MPRTLILGGGIAGLATAYHLARRGVGVTLLEREASCGSVSSAKSAAILRTAVPEPAVAALTRRTAAMFAQPYAEDFGAEPLCDGRGLLLIAGARAEAPLAAMLKHADRDDALRLTGDELLARTDPLALPRHTEAATHGWLFPREGRIAFERLLAGLVTGCRRMGVDLRTGTAAERLLVENGTVRGARLPGGVEVEADQTVLAAGAWAGRLGRDAGSAVDLTATRRHLAIAYFSTPAPADAPIVWDLETDTYARPERGGWMVCSCDRSDVADPDQLAEDPAVVAGLLKLAEDVVGAPPARHEAWAGLRTMTADDEFAIGPDPDLAGLAWSAGLGGAGMGAGWAAGDLLAELLTGGEDPLAHAFDPARLKASGTVRSAARELH